MFRRGHGWAHSQRPDPAGRHLCFYTNDCQTHDVYIRNNIFCQATDVAFDALWWKPETMSDPRVIRLDHNCWLQPEGQMIRLRGKSYTQAQFAAYQRDTGQEAHSLAADPRLADPAKLDFHLRPGSPCLGAGADLGHLADFDRRPIARGKAPAIGAFEPATQGPSGRILYVSPNGQRRLVGQTARAERGPDRRAVCVDHQGAGCNPADEGQARRAQGGGHRADSRRHLSSHGGDHACAGGLRHEAVPYLLRRLPGRDAGPERRQADHRLEAVPRQDPVRAAPGGEGRKRGTSVRCLPMASARSGRDIPIWTRPIPVEKGSCTRGAARSDSPSAGCTTWAIRWTTSCRCPRPASTPCGSATPTA